jgi:sn-1 stearoyl-lipid 9-desaturase
MSGMKLDPRQIQLVNIFICIFLAGFFWNWHFLILSVLMYFLLLGLGINIGLHRGFSHGRLSPESPLGRLCLFFSVLTCMGKPSDWILVHRLHHSYTDQDLDPHSPLKQGRWKVFTNTWTLSKEIPLRSFLAIKKTIRKNPSILFFDKYYWAVLVGYVSVLAIAGGFGLVIFAWCLPASLALLATSLVNTFCHGPDGKVSDVKWISILTLGEGYHGYHHEQPHSIGPSVPFVFDMSGWFLKKVTRRVA